MFAKANFIGLRRGVCLSVLILVAALGMPTLAMAQVARNTATVTPPGGVTNPGTQCLAPAVFTPATGVCASTDEDPITRSSDLTIVKTEREGSTAGFTAGPLTVAIGATVEFRIVVGNGGPSLLTGAVFRDVVPTNFSALSVVSVVPSVAPEVAASACTANIAGNTLSGVFSGPMGSSCSVIIRGTASIAAAAPGVTNTATATPPEGTTDPNGASSSVQTIINAPALKLSKSGALSTDKKTVSYSFVVENTGNVDLSAVTVTDPKLPALSCPPITLAVGASQTLVCTNNVYTVSSLDNAAGKVDNTATASGTPPSGPAVSANDTATVPLQTAPALKLSKSGTLAIDKKTISYSFVVENTGNVDLSAVTVTDPKLPALSCPPITLAVGASQTLVCTNNVYTVSSLDNAAGKVDNTATASGTPPSGPAISANDTATVPLQAAPALKLSKSGTLATDKKTISYSFVVENTGNVDLTAVTVTDPKLPALACPPIALAVGASQTLVCTGNVYTVSSLDNAAGKVDNTATASGTPPSGPAVSTTGTATVPLQAAPALKLSKSGTLATDKKSISYSFVVENTGNVDLSAVTVTDPKLPALSCPPITLAVGASQTLVCTNNVYTVSSLDNAAGKVDNTATASGTPPSGPAISANDTATVPLQAAPALKLSKSGTLATDKKTISYSFVVENTGNVDLTAVTVTDPKLPALSCPPITLAVGASQPLVCTGNVYNVSSLDNAAGKVDNTATASGTPPSGPAVSTTGTATVPLQAVPALTLSKSGTLSADQASISYSFTVTNTGNVDLSNVTLTDPMLPTLNCPAITLLVGATQTLACTNTSHNTTESDYVSGAVVNTATVTATPPGGGNPITATDTVTTPLVNSLNPVDDARTTAQNTSVTVDVQANDTVVGARLNPLSVTILSNPSHGTFSLNPDGTVVYTPNTNFSGVDTFVYQICNTASPTPACKSAIVTITVPPNRIDAVDDSARTPLDTPVSLDVIGNDTTAGLPLDPASVTVVTPPTHGAVSCNAGSCLYTPNPGYVGEDSFVYRVCDVSQPIPVCDTATATISIEGNTQVRVSKQASPRDVKVGDLVRYTVTMENVGESEVVDASLVDTPPPGFTLVVGSLQVADRDGAGRLAGSYPIRVDQIDIDKGARVTISYLLRVGAGVRGGLHVNAAEVHDNGRRISNVATATVQMVSDPMTDEATLLGTVFDDRDGDGWQDSAEMSDIRLQGGFVPGAYIANSTTVDRGNGPQTEADASAPLLHGIALGRIGGRQSDADPAQARQVVVSQRLRSLDFSNDFVLTTAQGSTLRMDAAGNTTLSAESGDAARGLSAATPSVQRTVSPAEQGYRVDYIIRNEGVDERGVPGVRIASVEGLLVETDQYGRYNLIGVDAGRDDRGRNFILKVDPATLPPGSVFTTRNPLLRRVTPGLPVRFDFGVKLPPALLQGGVTQPVVMELGAVMFAAGSAQLRSEYLPVVESMAAQVRSHGGGEVVIGAQGESELLAFDRAVALRKALVAALPADVAALTRVSLRTDSGDDSRRVLELGAWPLLGTTFFDTDKASIKPEYDALLAHIVSYLLEMDVPTIKVIGHADRRASAAYNDALGMRRAKAVFDALSAQLPAAQRGRIKVEILPGEPDASSGQADAEATP